MQSEPAGILLEPPAGDESPLPVATFGEQTVLVTGGSIGLGFAVAEAFARAGADIAIVGRSMEEAEAAAEAIGMLRRRAFAISADVREPASAARALDAAEAALGPVHYLANAAWAEFPVSAEVMSDNDWESVTRTLIDGTWHFSREFSRRRVRAGGGAIVNISAYCNLAGSPGSTHSAAAGSAVASMTRSFARQVRADGIRVNCVAGGLFAHEASPVDQDRYGLTGLGNTIPAGRLGQIQEVGWTAAYLCSPYARAITGQVLVVDGGDSLRNSRFGPPFAPMQRRDNVQDTQA